MLILTNKLQNTITTKYQNSYTNVSVSNVLNYNTIYTIMFRTKIQ